MRGEDWDIHKVSRTWNDKECDFAVGQGIGEIRGIAIALDSDGKESIAHELLDAAQYIECGYMRQKALFDESDASPQSDAERTRWREAQEALSKALNNMSD